MSSSMPPRSHSFNDVAVAIAMKKQRDKAKQEETKLKETSAVSKRSRTHPSSPGPSTSPRSFRSNNASWIALRDGLILYGFCIGVPTLIGMALQGNLWEDSISWLQRTHQSINSTLCERGWTWWCPESSSGASALAPDAELTDVGIVAFLSISLALVRMLCVHLLVPRYLTSPQRFQALVRCKSVHLLSSAYPKTLTPRSSGEFKIIEDVSSVPPPPLLSDEDLMMPDLDPSQQQQGALQSSTEPQEPWWRVQVRRVWNTIHTVWSTGRRASRRVLGLEAKAPYEGEELQDTDRLFAGPRYATAVFRFLYCLGSCACALVWFRSSDFWPFAIGGHGSTKNCWNLKGGVALEDLQDTDFDQRNAVLRLYFLVQASYHLHSWATHVVSMFVLLYYKGGGSTLVSMRKSMLSYWRALLQHLIALGLIGGCYLFSSLRRLGAIGIFALDLSSLFVHFLQVCINAPQGSVLRRPKLIAWAHRGLVVPVFVYTRFYVFPFVVWYSAVYESHAWLQQMERTIVPGSERAMQVVFHMFLVVLTGLNLIMTERLIRHPHLQRVMQEEGSFKKED